MPLLVVLAMGLGSATIVIVPKKYPQRLPHSSNRGLSKTEMHRMRRLSFALMIKAKSTGAKRVFGFYFGFENTSYLKFVTIDSFNYTKIIQIGLHSMHSFVLGKGMSHLFGICSLGQLFCF